MKDNKELLEGLKAGLFNNLYISYNGNLKEATILKSLSDTSITNNYGTRLDIEEIKPHYFPLSMLTKPIKVSGYNDGKEFVPIEELQKVIFAIDKDLYIDLIEHHSPFVEKNDYFEIIILLDKWHFNRFNLDTEKFIDASISKVYDND